jgi:hypothetical protein
MIITLAGETAAAALAMNASIASSGISASSSERQ